MSAIALITGFTPLAVAQAVGDLQHCQFISRGLFIDTVHGCHVWSRDRTAIIRSCIDSFGVRWGERATDKLARWRRRRSFFWRPGVTAFNISSECAAAAISLAAAAAGAAADVTASQWMPLGSHHLDTSCYNQENITNSTPYVCSIRAYNLRINNMLFSMVTSHLGDKPSGPQTSGRQTNGATANWATHAGQLGDRNRNNWTTTMEVWTINDCRAGAMCSPRTETV